MEVSMEVRIAGILLAGLLVACGSDDDDDGQIVAQVAADLDGDYNLTAPATTAFGTDGGQCGDGSGTLTLTDGAISGTAVSTGGLVFDLNGNVTDDGNVTGGFALSGENVVMFTGLVADSVASGSWEDNFGCLGTWEATLNP